MGNLFAAGSTPLTFTPLGGACICASSVIGATNGLFGIYAFWRGTTESIRYWYWNRNEITKSQDPDMWIKCLRLLHELTSRKIAAGESLNTTLISNEITKNIFSRTTVKTTMPNGSTTYDETDEGKHIQLPNTHPSHRIVNGPVIQNYKKQTKTTIGPDGKPVFSTVETHTSSVQQTHRETFVISPGVEFELKIKNETDATTEYTFWIKYIKSSPGKEATIVIYSQNDQPTAFNQLTGVTLPKLADTPVVDPVGYINSSSQIPNMLPPPTSMQNPYQQLQPINSNWSPTHVTF